MKQKKLVKKLLRACMKHDSDKINELRLLEYKKIFKHKKEGKHWDSKWTLVQI